MQDDSGGAMAERRRSRSWSVRVVGLLLILQAAAYVACSIVMLLPLEWTTAIRLAQQSEALSLSFTLIPATLLAILSAVGFLLLFRAGWLLAMAMQGATLLGCLVLYFGTKPKAIFPVMLYCVVMAFYLNARDVRVAFYGGVA